MKSVIRGFSMRYLSAVFLLSTSLIAATPAARAVGRRGVRKVELISMTVPPPIAKPPEAPDAAQMREAPSSDLAAAALSDQFKVHDLSRRYVEFRMKQELAGIAEAQAVSGSPGVPSSSSIPVPAWMRASYTPVSSVAFAPGCSPLAYRPSGFLARSAETRRAAYYGMMSAIACEHGIPTGLFDAMIIRESGYNPIATSTKNAFGFAQLMPATAAGLGVDRYDPLENMRGGARYLRQQLDRFGQVQLALAAYNAGPGRVRGGLVPRITETQAYVTNIIANWSRLTSQPGSAAFQSTLSAKTFRNVGYTHF
jgi:soluble lytic murein transglycosylase-like protein